MFMDDGWKDSTDMGVKLVFDQSTVPTMPSDMTPQNWEEEESVIIHERKARECGVKA